jgi:CheY-like chemotaxis protein
MRALLRHIHSDLVILDLSPEKRDDGYQLLMRLWNDAETAHIPAIIITGEPGLPPVRAGMLHTRHRQVVAKPGDREALLAAIKTVCDFSRTVSDGRGVAHESSS